MFDALRQMQQIKKMSDELKQQQVTVEESGVSLTMRGDFDLLSLHLNPDLDAASQERVVLQLFQKAKDQIQGMIASNFKGSLFG